MPPPKAKVEQKVPISSIREPIDPMIPNVPSVVPAEVALAVTTEVPPEMPQMISLGSIPSQPIISPYVSPVSSFEADIPIESILPLTPPKVELFRMLEILNAKFSENVALQLQKNDNLYRKIDKIATNNTLELINQSDRIQNLQQGADHFQISQAIMNDHMAQRIDAFEQKFDDLSDF
jgi:hypothetical protein